MSENKPKLTDPKLDELCEDAARFGYRTAITDATDKLLAVYPKIKDKDTFFIAIDLVKSLFEVNKRLT